MDKKSDMYKAMFGKDVPKAQGGEAIKNLHDALKIDPSTPGYGKKVGPKTLDAYMNFLYDYFKNQRGYEDLNKDDFFGGKDWKRTDKDAYRDEIMNRFFKDGKINLIPGEAEALGLTTEGYKKTAQPVISPEKREEIRKRILEGPLEKTKIDPKKGQEYLERIKKELDAKTDAYERAKQEKIDEALDYAKTISSQVAPYLNRPFQEGLDPSQILGELTAMATNQLQPVQAQLFQPELAVPMGGVSLKEQLNANQADFNALQRTLGYNPEALYALAAQKYSANQKTLADEFRLNQELQNQVFNKNRDLLNDAKLKNLGILDTQYQRQEAAKSNTKATLLTALSSIADKTLQNKSENRTLAAYSNMFPQYGFGPDMRAMNRGLTFFNMSNPSTTTPTTTAAPTSKNGGKTKKPFTNNSILKMYKG